jgi:hypothetical protein
MGELLQGDLAVVKSSGIENRLTVKRRWHYLYNRAHI